MLSKAALIVLFLRSSSPIICLPKTHGLSLPFLWNKRSHWVFFFFIISLSLCINPRPPVISTPWALGKVILSLWWCFDSSLPPLFLPPFLFFSFLTGKLESHHHQGAKKGLVPSAADWRWRKGSRGTRQITVFKQLVSATSQLVCFPFNRFNKHRRNITYIWKKIHYSLFLDSFLEKIKFQNKLF